MKMLRLATALALLASPALAQNGTVTSHAFSIGKGPGVTGFTSLLCTSAQLAVGQAAADPICQTITGDVTISAGGVTAIGSGKVVSAMLGADVFSTAHSWSGQQTFTAPVLGTPASGTLTNATGLPISTGISGLATGIASFLATPSSANLRAALTDEVGTGAAYFIGGALGTPASATLTNATGLPLTTGVTGNLPNANLGTMVANTIKGAVTAGTPTDLAIPSCSTTSSALTWTTSTGFGCNSITGSGGGRTILSSNLNFYINATSGTDNTICGLTSGASACATLNYGRNRVMNGYDLAGFAVTFHVTGTFSAGLSANGMLLGATGPGSEIWAAENGVTINAGSNNIAIWALYNAMLEWTEDTHGLTLTAGGTTGICVATSQGGYVNFVSGSLTTNGCGQYTLQTSWGGTIIEGMTMFFQGNNNAAIYISGGVIQFNPGVATGVIGNPTYATAFVWSYNGTFGSGASYGGTAIGTRWKAELNGVISCGCTPNSAFPGTVNGSTVTGGQQN